MNTIANIDELNKLIRNQLIIQAELPSNRVRNALTTYGAMLDKLLTKQEFDSVCPCEELMLFELKTRENDADVSMTENEDASISYYKSYSVYIILYGNNSATIMNKLIARLRTQAVRQALYEEGVYIEEVKNDLSINEFKNDVMWHRHDTEILISCKMSIKQVTPDNAFEKLNPVNIIIKGEQNDE